MSEEFNVRQFFGAVDRFRERMICSQPMKFDVDILSLTMSQQRLLRELLLQTGPESEGISLKNLADELNLSSSAVSVMVEMLVQKKVLERKSSEVDRRQVLIRLSDAAWESVALYDAACRMCFSDFSEEELSLLRKISERLSQSGNIDISKTTKLHKGE